MNAQEQTIQGLYEHAQNPKEMERMHHWLNELLGQEGKLYSIPSMTMIGYYFMPYQKATYPMIALAPQKNHIGLYVMAWEKEQSVLEKYQQYFPKTMMGKGCIRIKNWEKVDQETLKQLILEAKSILESQQ
ncbi:MAG: DUF1801 domain-containing protein [Erysipelotrichaceae bacterium]